MSTSAEFDVDSATLADHGFMVIRDAVSRQDLNEMAAFIEEQCWDKGSAQLMQNIHGKAAAGYRIALCDPIQATLKSVFGCGFLVWASTLLVKQSGIASSVRWHQDGVYWPNFPKGSVSAWIAIDPAPVCSGCLSVVPRSHCMGAMPIKLKDAPKAGFNFDRHEAQFSAPMQTVDLPCKSGDIVLFSDLLIHGSAVQTEPARRAGLVIRYVAADVHVPPHWRQDAIACSIEA